MIFCRLPVEDAMGAILAHNIRTNTCALKKGHKLTAGDIKTLADAKIPSVMAARLESGDIPEDQAASQVAATAHGPYTHLRPAFTGRRNLYASTRGLAIVDRDRVDAINSVDESITLTTVSPYTIVDENQLVATVKVIPLAVNEDIVTACQTLANEDTPVVSVAPLKRKSVGLISTWMTGTKNSVLKKTVSTIRERVESLGSELTHSQLCRHCEADITAAIHDLILKDCTLILILGATAIVDRRDVVPHAIVNAGGSIEHFGMPVDPGNLTLLANVGGTLILGLPGSARSRRIHGSDLLLQRLLADVVIRRQDIMALGVGGLVKELPGRPQPRDVKIESPTLKHNVAAIVLAAGESKRMGKKNKLLVQLDGLPMVVRVANAILSSRATPVVVVTGHQYKKVEKILTGRDIVLVHNLNYAKGLSSSLAAGIDALPPVDAALVCLGDMPNITSAHLNRLISAFAPIEKHSICVPTYKGKRGNPVLWSASYFGEMRALSGDFGARQLILDHHTEVHEVEMDDSSILTDVDTPEALTALHMANRNS